MKVWLGFLKGVLGASLVLLVVGLAAFGIEAIIRWIYHPSTHLWWFVVLAVFLIVLGGVLGVFWAILKKPFIRRKRK